VCHSKQVYGCGIKYTRILKYARMGRSVEPGMEKLILKYSR
jgi:hypothetical protein